MVIAMLSEILSYTGYVFNVIAWLHYFTFHYDQHIYVNHKNEHILIFYKYISYSFNINIYNYDNGRKY